MNALLSPLQLLTLALALPGALESIPNVQNMCKCPKTNIQSPNKWSFTQIVFNNLYGQPNLRQDKGYGGNAGADTTRRELSSKTMAVGNNGVQQIWQQYGRNCSWGGAGRGQIVFNNLYGQPNLRQDKGYGGNAGADTTRRELSSKTMAVGNNGVQQIWQQYELVVYQRHNLAEECAGGGGRAGGGGAHRRLGDTLCDVTKAL